jgi:predicted kinase
MTLLVMGIGIPGSGKSTFLEKLAKQRNYFYLSVDAVRKELAGNEADQSVNTQAWSIARGRLAQRLAHEESVVFDATFAKGEERREFIQYAREKGVTVLHGYYFDVPLDIAKERNAQRKRAVRESALDRLHTELQKDPPTEAEGFDTLFTVDEYGRARI